MQSVTRIAARSARFAARHHVAAASVRATAVVAGPAVADRLMGATRMASGNALPHPRLPGYESSTTIQDVFGINSFNDRAMRNYLSKSVFADVQDCIKNRKPMPAELADHFAQGLQRWAEERGATHFTHWFQPLTGTFATKHDSMIKKDGDNVITQLTGKMLVIGEPDGSSFPNGGLRDTHQARGYTVWDPSTPCFVTSHGSGTTLNIPSVFFSWKGDALDEKTPLLRSVESLDREGIALLKAIGEAGHKQVHTDSGIEQEFFLVDEDFVARRPDIMQAGRSLLGAAPPKGQALDDQYFGAFSDRFLAAMNDAEVEMWKLGIPQTTRHREVAPGQYEMAPVYCPANVSGDYNLLQMDVLTKVCGKHGLTVLFHEKPFAGVNGSGKHNNWSIGTKKIGTLLEPGSKPEENLLFMTVIAATVRAVRQHGDVLRTAVSGAGNDHRLGANEAPPAIMSVYLGEDLTDAVNRFLGRDVPPRTLPSGDLGIGVLPEFKIDTVDRNRTSPIAFTGNKFEFRAVGSSHNPSRSTTFLNTAVTDSLRYMREKLASSVSDGASKAEIQATFKKVVQDTLVENEAALFDGDNYSQAWADEAESRGLLNLRTTVDAIDAFDSDKNYELFGTYGVLSKDELGARVNVMREEYCTRIMTEANGTNTLVQNAVMPAAFDIQTKAAGSIIAAKSAGVADLSAQEAYLDNIVSLVNGLSTAVAGLKSAQAAMPEGDLAAEARHCNDVVVPAMAAVRECADGLEDLCDSDVWGLPNYHEMLFHQS